MFNHQSFLKDLSYFSQVEHKLPKTRRQEKIEKMSYDEQLDMALKESLNDVKDRNVDPVGVYCDEYIPSYTRRNHQRTTPKPYYFRDSSCCRNCCCDFEYNNHYNNDSDLSRAIEESIKEQRMADEKLRQQKNKEEVQNQSIRTNQNDEYDKLLQETLLSRSEEYKEKREQNNIKMQEEKKAKEQKENLQKLIENIKQEAEKLPPEPETGVSIAVILPNQKRIIRKFDPNEQAQDVYTWVAADDSLIQDETYSTEFDLVCPFSPVLDRHKTIAAQGFKGRVLFNVQTK